MYCLHVAGSAGRYITARQVHVLSTCSWLGSAGRYITARQVHVLSTCSWLGSAGRYITAMQVHVCTAIHAHLVLFLLLQADRDPKRINWLFKILVGNPLEGDNGSFVDSW